MNEMEILNLLVELNQATDKLNKHAVNAVPVARPSATRLQIAGEVAKFLRQSIVLLPPEASAEYCSKCGKKL